MVSFQDTHTFSCRGHQVFRLRGGVSQGSDCDSDGLPGYMQGGYGNDVEEMELIRNRREVEDFPVLVASGGDVEVLQEEDMGLGAESGNNELEKVFDNGILSPRSAKLWVQQQELKQQELKKQGIKVVHSSSGGILLEDVCNSSDEDANGLVSDREAMEGMTVNRASKAAFAINKFDREELFSTRKKMMELQDFMERNGLSMAALKKN